MEEHEGIKGDLTFNEWIDHVFDHSDPGWHWEDDAPYWNPLTAPSQALSFLGRLFSNPSFLIDLFTPNQIGGGLNFLVNNSCSNYAFVFLNEDLPIEERVRGIHAIGTLYLELLSRICQPELSHGRRAQSPESTQADYICYMFWDLFPLYARSKSPFKSTQAEVAAHLDDHLKVEAACLDAMETTLAIEHIACQEGALHGLGHWATDYPERVRGIIDAFLRSTDPRDGLLVYAKAARRGDVQ